MPAIRQATPADAQLVADILAEAARWLTERGMPLWHAGELDAAAMQQDIVAGMYFLAEQGGEPAGVVRFQLEDRLFWPDDLPGEAAYLHRFAVRRKFAGGGVATALLHWAVAQTRAISRRWLRLDCEAARLKLRAVYERFGFRHRDDRQVGPYYVSRYEYELGD